MHITAGPLGARVKFRDPATADEASERYVILELRGDRVLVEYICDMQIKPQFVYPLADLTEA